MNASLTEQFLSEEATKQLGACCSLLIVLQLRSLVAHYEAADIAALTSLGFDACQNALEEYICLRNFVPCSTYQVNATCTFCARTGDRAF